MQQRFNKFIQEEHLFADGQQVLLAVSGGRDSVTLCHLIASAHIPFAIAHCNFYLRPGDCDRDEAFVRRLANNYGVPCFVASFDTEAYARAEGLSIEEAARKLRYEFFEQQRQSNGYDLIATAHHRDDAIETFFINLLRGTGITGLHGIPLRNGNIVRPLLPFGRDEIDAYIRKHNLEYVEDYTNSQTLYMRNRIRHQLVPLMRQLSPSFDTVMQSNIARIAEAEQIYQSEIEHVRRTMLQPYGDGYAVDIHTLRALSPLSTYLFEILRPFGFSSVVVGEISKSLDSQSGKQFFSSSHRIVKDRKSLLIFPYSAESSRQSEYIVSLDRQNSALPLPLHFEVCDRPDGAIRLGRNEAWFDFDKVKQPLTLRHWRNGDRFTPFGMKGSRLVSDLFSDLKLSLNEKESTWILCDVDGTILWVVGLRASATASVTPSTKRVLKVLQ